MLLSYEDNHDPSLHLREESGRLVHRHGCHLTVNYLIKIRKSREFHSFSEDEFGDDGYLADAWGGKDIRLLVDYNGDGLIELSSEAVDEIKKLFLLILNQKS